MTAAAPPNHTVAAFRFSTDDIPERDRLTAWREVFGRTVCSLDIAPLTPKGFHSTATAFRLPGLGVLAGVTSGVDLTHSQDLIADDDLSFMTGPMPKWTASQLGRNPVLGAGDGCLMNNAEVGSMCLPSATRFITFRVPVAAIKPLVHDVDACVAKRIPAASEGLRLLAGYLGILKDAIAMATPELQELAATHVCDLLALTLGATHEAEEVARGRGLRAARLYAVLAEIKAGFADQKFSSGEVARTLGLSERYVQDLLHHTGLHFSERVLELRLQKAGVMLASARHRHLKVIEIALACGFGDISYFNRCFRRRFGASPSEFRGSGSADG
ncbi:MAG TPA: AraC family transcriptional regulator [Xanthobacteraceae bacterium]|jgi:AraC-like DNA-binding protein